MKSAKNKIKPFKVSSFSQKQLIVFAAVFGLIGGYMLFKALAAPVAPTIYLTPDTRTLAPSTTFTVDVREDSGGSSVNAGQANISYPASLVDFVSINTNNSAFTTEAESTGGNGQIKIGRGIIGTLTGDRLVATITFRTKTTGGTANVAFTTGSALVSSSNNQNLLASLSATGGGSYTIDTVNPSVSITSPFNGATISKGTTVSVTASASDAGGVSSVQFLVDGASAGTDNSSPYTYSWNTSSLSLGSHTLQAKATDASGNVGTSSTVTVTVADQTPPTVSVTAPASGSQLNGTVSFTASASDNSGGTGVNKVEFYVDGTLKSSDTSSPYSYSWDTTTASNGSHGISVKAYDNASPANVATSSTVNVTVDNSAPSAPGSFRTTGNTQTSIALAWNASSDNNGVTGYRLSRNGSTVANLSGSTLTYNDTNRAAGTSYDYTVVALDAAGNVSSAATLTASTKSATPGDVNGDDAVNITDLSILISNWNGNDSASDVNADGVVNIFDLSILLSHWTG
jgi:chitodextrinase